jgi:hypothetical protein
MNERIRQLLLEAQALAREEVKRTPELAKYAPSYAIPGTEIHVGLGLSYEKFAELIVRECINKIETHRIPVGNSAAGEMACEMTYSALMEIRDEIKEHFGVEE